MYIIWTAICPILFQLSYGKLTDQLKGHDLRVSAITVQGFLLVDIGPDGNYTFHGQMKDYLDSLFHEPSGFKYHFVVINSTIAAARGFAQASIDQLLNGDVDISSLGYVVTMGRLRFMDFTVPTLIESYVLIVPYPQERSLVLGPLKPFQSEVWLVLFLTFVAVIISLSLLPWNIAGPRSTSKTIASSISDNAVYVLTTLVSNAEYHNGKTLSLRLLLAFWCLTCVIFVNSYTGNLISYLTVPALESVPNSFEELAARKDLSLIIEDKSILAEEILKASSGPLKVLGDSLRKNSDHLFRTVPKSEELLFTLKTVYPGMISISSVAIANYLKHNGNCGITMSKPIPHTIRSSYALPKNSPYREALNNRIYAIEEMGIPLHLRKKYLPRIEKCLLENHREKSKSKRLKLEAFAIAFVILGCGTGLSLAAFVAERIIMKAKK